MNAMSEQVKKVQGGYMCRRGVHLWFDQADAEKCCDPAWKRILVLYDGTHQQLCAGVPCGRKWVKADQ